MGENVALRNGDCERCGAMSGTGAVTRALAAPPASATAGWAYLDRAMLRSLGPVPSRLFGQVMTTDWSIAFDGVLVIRDEGTPTFEPRR